MEAAPHLLDCKQRYTSFSHATHLGHEALPFSAYPLWPLRLDATSTSDVEEADEGEEPR